MASGSGGFFNMMVKKHATIVSKRKSRAVKKSKKATKKKSKSPIGLKALRFLKL